MLTELAQRIFKSSPNIRGDGNVVSIDDDQRRSHGSCDCAEYAITTSPSPCANGCGSDCVGCIGGGDHDHHAQPCMQQQRRHSRHHHQREVGKLPCRIYWLLGALSVCVSLGVSVCVVYMGRYTDLSALHAADLLGDSRLGAEMRRLIRDEALVVWQTANGSVRETTAAVPTADTPDMVTEMTITDNRRIMRSTTHHHLEPPDYDDTTAVGERHQRKMSSHLHNILRERREASLALDNLLRVAPPSAEDADKTYVEFFNPKFRRELEKKDDEYKKQHGTKGAAPGGDDWVWLTSYCRIPYESITGFCSSTKDYCPAGPAGVPGTIGQKGYRGDIGMPGPPGREGVAGARGPKGMPGASGLDGRDGVPGEPGLDGVPGRAGADGIPGKDGKHGMAGKDGQNGQNGRDGKEGLPGLQGPPGIPGERGLTGPKGRVGRPGNNGKNGDNGVCVYGKMVNGTIAKELIIPPSIALNSSADVARPIVVYEGRHLRLRCPATGLPRPHVEWRRVDQQTTRVGAYDDSSMSGHTLNITKINRVHMGAYQCVADNGVPPAASFTFSLEVHFAPLIRVRYQHVYAAEGNSVTLECEMEAFPEPVKFWKRRLDNRILEPSDKFRMETTLDGYKSKMQLNITRIRAEDYGEYHCVAKNEVNTTTGILYVNDRTKPPNRGYADVPVVFGPEPPPNESYEDICGPPTTCPDCQDVKDAKCRDSLPLYDLVGHLEIKPTDPKFKYPGLPNRTFECVLYAVGKPVFHKFTGEDYGAWLRDPAPRNEAVSEMFWATSDTDNMNVYEYANKIKFRTDPTRVHRLAAPGFVGNAHAVYNGSFYYQELYSNRVVRFDLESSKPAVSNIIPEASPSGANYLYTSKHNYMDFNVEDNGLWVIFSTPKSNNTNVAKLDANTLLVQYSWNVSINHHKVGDMFIACGVLYAVDSVTERLTKIRLALDLYKNMLLEDVNLSFTNPFKHTTTVGYNHRSKELYTWDRGNQLSYPTRYHAIGSNATSQEKSDDLPYAESLSGYDLV